MIHDQPTGSSPACAKTAESFSSGAGECQRSQFGLRRLYVKQAQGGGGLHRGRPLDYNLVLTAHVGDQWVEWANSVIDYESGNCSIFMVNEMVVIVTVLRPHLKFLLSFGGMPDMLFTWVVLVVCLVSV